MFIRKSVVDSTGDADVCKLAGAKTANFAKGNRVASWYYSLGGGRFKLNMCGEHALNDDDLTSDLGSGRRFTGVDTYELSEMVQIGHDAMMSSYLKHKQDTPDLVPTTIATLPDVRMTRRLVGAYTQDVAEAGVSYPDSVGIFPNWIKVGPVYELPFSTLYGNEVKNLLAAGRCISVTDAMWDVTRVIPVCAVTGEAAGAAAAMCSDIAELDIRKLQTHLEKCGVKLHNDIED